MLSGSGYGLRAVRQPTDGEDYDPVGFGPE